MRRFGAGFPNNVVNRLSADGAIEALVNGGLDGFALLVGRKRIEPCTLFLGRSSPRIDVDADGFEHVHDVSIAEDVRNCQKIGGGGAVLNAVIRAKNG